jgi:hypothetical protein
MKKNPGKIAMSEMKRRIIPFLIVITPPSSFYSKVSHLKLKNLDEENGFTLVRYLAKGAREMVTPLNPKAVTA